MERAPRDQRNTPSAINRVSVASEPNRSVHGSYVQMLWSVSRNGTEDVNASGDAKPSFKMAREASEHTLGAISARSTEILRGESRMKRSPFRARFMAKFDRKGDSECWEWRSAKLRGGYGKFKVGKDQRMAHRVAYWLLRGPVPDYLTLDHLCRNKCCVNPAHLEPVTMRENARRGWLARKGQAQKPEPTQ